MNCKKFDSDISELLLGVGHPGQPLQHELQAHLRDCPDCRRTYDRLADVWVSLEQIAGTPGTNVRESVRRLIDAANSVSVPLRASARTAEPLTAGSRVREGTMSGVRIHARRLLVPLAAAAAALFIGVHWGGLHGDQTGDLESRISALENEALAARLSQTDAADRLMAIHRLSGAGRGDETVVSALLRSLEEDPSVNVRLAAVEALSGHFRNEQTVVRAARSANAQPSPLVQLAILQHFQKLPTAGLKRAAARALDPARLAPETRDLASQLGSVVQ